MTDSKYGMTHNLSDKWDGGRRCQICGQTVMVRASITTPAGTTVWCCMDCIQTEHKALMLAELT